jgi:hypothetical protein
MAHAKVKHLLQKFLESTSAEIQVATANALKGWCEQTAKLQVLRADKANREFADPDSGSWIRPTAKPSNKI